MMRRPGEPGRLRQERPVGVIIPLNCIASIVFAPRNSTRDWMGGSAAAARRPNDGVAHSNSAPEGRRNVVTS